MTAPGGIEVPWQSLSPDTLTALIEEYVTRSGTDYGALEATFERKVKDIRVQLERGEVIIVFDPSSETCDLRPLDKKTSSSRPS